jgi:hypothetical protein
MQREHNFPTTAHGCVITPKGIIIGGAVERRKACMSTSAAIAAQSCLLPPPRRASVRDQLVELVYTAPRPILLSIVIGGGAVGLIKVLAR